jgi:nitroreductase
VTLGTNRSCYLNSSPVIEALIQRSSCAHLTDPAPSADEMALLYKAAGRAADHRNLKPWRFLEISGKGLDQLGQLFLESWQKTAVDLPEESRNRALALPRRAPLIVVAIASIHEDPKVPEIEQVLATGAAVQNLLNAAYALGLGAIWRTGDFAFNPNVAEGLGLAVNERLIGFIYLGTPNIPLRVAAEPEPRDFVSVWP